MDARNSETAEAKAAAEIATTTHRLVSELQEQLHQFAAGLRPKSPPPRPHLCDMCTQVTPLRCEPKGLQCSISPAVCGPTQLEPPASIPHVANASKAHSPLEVPCAYLEEPAIEDHSQAMTHNKIRLSTMKTTQPTQSDLIKPSNHHMPTGMGQDNRRRSARLSTTAAVDPVPPGRRHGSPAGVVQERNHSSEHIRPATGDLNQETGKEVAAQVPPHHASQVLTLALFAHVRA